MNRLPLKPSLIAIAVLTPVTLAGVAMLWFRQQIGSPTPQGMSTRLLGNFVTWAVLTPILWHLIRRLRTVVGHWSGKLAALLGVGIVLTSIQLLGVTAIDLAFGAAIAPQPATFGQEFVIVAFRFSPFSFLCFWTLVTALFAVDATRRYRQRELEASRLSEELRKAQLVALRAQLHPHFLFNTLNTVSVYLLEDNVEAAREVVSSLGALMGRALEDHRKNEVRLDEELRFVASYLGIEQRRFSDRLRTRMHVDSSVESALIPTMLIQPIVENAVRHGISKSLGPGEVSISATRKGTSIDIRVEDSGPGFGESGEPPKGRGVGLRNATERLDRLYGRTASLTVGNRVGGGAVVQIVLPYHIDSQSDRQARVLHPFVDELGPRETPDTFRRGAAS